ncbi:hypothetical protein, partial [Candidatus Magnetobacterium casense]|uniref:hypothetical protein n=1 Tax=Candidatus Magnetobacterium casense TaxID=1455061 RepID=UPI001C44D9A1
QCKQMAAVQQKIIAATCAPTIQPDQPQTIWGNIFSYPSHSAGKQNSAALIPYIDGQTNPTSAKMRRLAKAEQSCFI